MIEFLTAPQNIAFGLALGVVMLLAFIEGVGTLLGMGISSALDSLFPDADINIDTPEFDGSSGLTKFLAWLNVDKVPVIVLFIVFLTSFGLLGYGVQLLAIGIIGDNLPGILAIAASLISSLPVIRASSSVLTRIIPKDETSAVSAASFVGRTAIITLGLARQNSPVQARVHDQHGKAHYIMVEPDVPGQVFKAGEEVLLVKQEGSIFKVITDTTRTLVN